MTPQFSIRLATASDIPASAKVAEETWLATYPNEEYGITADDIRAIGFQDPSRIEDRQKKFAQNDERRMWVAETDAGVVGFCRAVIKDGRREVKALYVLLEMQGRGIGRALLETAIEWLGGENQIFLEVAEYNCQATEFYKKHGFAETGVHSTPDIGLLPSGKEIPGIEMLRKPQ